MTYLVYLICLSEVCNTVRYSWCTLAHRIYNTVHCVERKLLHQNGARGGVYTTYSSSFLKLLKVVNKNGVLRAGAAKKRKSFLKSYLVKHCKLVLEKLEALTLAVYIHIQPV